MYNPNLNNASFHMGGDEPERATAAGQRQRGNQNKNET